MGRTSPLIQLPVLMEVKIKYSSIVSIQLQGQTKLTNLHVLCVRYLTEGVGLSIPIEMVSEPLAERQEHNLNGQTEGRPLGWRCG